MLESAENLFRNASAKEKSVFVALYIMFNSIVGEECRCKNFEVFLESHEEKLNTPNQECLIVLILLNSEVSWNIEVHQSIHDDYFKARPRPKGIHVPRVIEAALSLTLAERYRDQGNFIVCSDIVSRCIDNFPEHKGLREFGAALREDSQISWEDILLMKSE
jgi:hypothetical protein